MHSHTSGGWSLFSMTRRNVEKSWYKYKNKNVKIIEKWKKGRKIMKHDRGEMKSEKKEMLAAIWKRIKPV